MTPEERNLVTELFDRLATLEDAQRDPEAERLIRDGLRQAPNALYALVQTVLVQDEALKRADARIRELEGAARSRRATASFLGGMRDSLFGRREGRGSVPSVRPGEAPGRVAGLAVRHAGGRLARRWRRPATVSGPAAARPRRWRGRLVSRHRGGGRGRRDRRLAAAGRHPLMMGGTAGRRPRRLRSGAAAEARRRPGAAAARRRRPLPPGRPRRYRARRRRGR